MVIGFTSIFFIAVVVVAVGLPWLSLQNEQQQASAHQDDDPN
jgi:hypothetical protein